MIESPLKSCLKQTLVLHPPQVVTSIGELVEACSPQILSGWRPLFSALRTVHGGKADTKDYLLGEYSMGTRDLSVRVGGRWVVVPAEYLLSSALAPPFSLLLPAPTQESPRLRSSTSSRPSSAPTTSRCSPTLPSTTSCAS